MKKQLLIPFLVLPLLAGCGPKNNSYAYDLDFNVDVNGARISFWSPFGSDKNDVLKPLIDEFTRLTGVTVNFEPKSGYDTLRDAVNNAATTGGYPNVVLGYPDHFASYVKSDIIVRLDYYFENDVHNSTFEPDGVNFSKNDFYVDYMRENNSVEFKPDGTGYTLGVPFNKSTEVLIYNKNFFDYFSADNGLDTTWKSQIYVPETYDQLESVGQAILDFFDAKNLYGKKLYQDGAIGTPVNTEKLVIDLTGIVNAATATAGEKVNVFKPFSYDSQANLFITTVRQFGGTYTSYDKEANKGYLEFNSTETVNGLNRLKTLYDKNIFGIPADWGEASYGSNPFKACKTVMTLGSSAGVTSSTPAGNKFDIGVAPVLYHNEDRKLVISQGTNLALLDKGSRQERVASWQLIKFLSKYANGTFASLSSYYPSCEYAEKALPGSTKSGMWKGYDESEFQDYVTWKNEAINSFSMADKIKAQTANINIDYYTNSTLNKKWEKFIDQPFAGSADVRDVVASIPPYVFNGEKTAQEAINYVYDNLADYVRS